MKKTFKKLNANFLLGILAVSLFFVETASAQVTLPTAMDIAPVTSMIGIIIVGLSAMWGYRKLIKTVNRS